MPDGVLTVFDLWQRLHGTAPAPWYLLDVRNEDEFARWPVEGVNAPRTVNIPYFTFIDDLDAALARVPRDAGQAVVLCAKGDSSEFVRDRLCEAGLQAVHVGGGMAAWGTLHVPLRLTEPPEELQIWQVSRYGKGCLSYVLASDGDAVVVDPSRFVGVYEELARKQGARIFGVLDTHVHADHVSGAAELARRTGARYVSPLTTSGQHDVIGIGRVREAVRAMRTPGHTPESTSFLLASGHLLSGDTLFVGGVGRPDLGNELESWGQMLYASLRDVIGPLLPETVVLPAHFASAGEARRDGAVCATLGQLRDSLPELSERDPRAFLDRLAASITSPPPAYALIVNANRTLLDPGDAADEWELGRNECAAACAGRRSAPPRPPAGGHGAEGAHA